MKKTALLFALLALLSCSEKKENPSPSGNANCGSHNGKQLYLGPQGGCYYISSGGNKEYVDRSECSCTL